MLRFLNFFFSGIIAGAGTGLLRSLFCQRDLIADLIPVDIVINLMCAVAPEIAAHRNNSTGGISSGNKRHTTTTTASAHTTPIYNCTSGSMNPITWGDVETISLEHILNYPMNKMFW